jgi:hypothetical protein
MKKFNVFLPGFWRKPGAIRDDNKEKSLDQVNLQEDDDFRIFGQVGRRGDSYFLNAWVNIAVGILIRNAARAGFMLVKVGDEITGGTAVIIYRALRFAGSRHLICRYRAKVFRLFRRPNETMSRYDLWEETAAWWHLEGEAFWWFGPDYSAGIPKAIYMLDPRRMRNEEPVGRGW